MSSSTFSHLPWAGSVSSTCAGLCVSHTLAADWSAFFQEADGPMEWRSQTENYVANPCVFVGIDQISLTKFRLIVDEFSEMQDMLGDMMMYNVYIYIYINAFLPGSSMNVLQCCIHHYVLGPRQHLGCALWSLHLSLLARPATAERKLHTAYAA